MIHPCSAGVGALSLCVNPEMSMNRDKPSSSISEEYGPFDDDPQDWYVTTAEIWDRAVGTTICYIHDTEHSVFTLYQTDTIFGSAALRLRFCTAV